MSTQLKFHPLLFLSLLSFSAFAQDSGEAAAIPEEQAVIQVIQNMFDAMRESDTAKLAATFDPKMRLMTTYTDKEGNPKIHTGSARQFIESIAKPHDEMYDEKIWSYEVDIDGLLASVWTEYTFYVGEKMSHCGVNAFQLFKTAEGWKIIQITDTRNKEGCQTGMRNHEEEVNTFMDAWHLAAARADEDAFFGSMTEDAIYIGTDASERWLRDELKAWSQQYFERDKAWDFKATKRKVYFSGNKKTAWFEESLDTWMGLCRGSGVLTQTEEGWKIKHYHLARTIPNDKVDGVLQLMKD